MSRWRKKPVIIDAFKWTGDETQKEDPYWADAAIKDGVMWFENVGTPEVTMKIKTLEGIHTANRGDYIIRGIKMEIYPCKPDIFEATYEYVGPDDYHPN